MRGRAAMPPSFLTASPPAVRALHGWIASSVVHSRSEWTTQAPTASGPTRHQGQTFLKHRLRAGGVHAPVLHPLGGHDGEAKDFEHVAQADLAVHPPAVIRL